MTQAQDPHLDPIGEDYNRPVGDEPPLAPGDPFIRPFMVQCVEDGGDDGGGDPPVDCTWTYTLYTMDLEDILKKNAAGDDATEMSPERPRLDGFEYQHVGVGGGGDLHPGLAYYDADGNLHLIECLTERARYSDCES